MPVPSAPSVARHRRRTYQHARTRLPWLPILAGVSFTIGVTIAALSDPTTRAILAVFAVGYLVVVVLHKGAERFNTEDAA